MTLQEKPSKEKDRAHPTDNTKHVETETYILQTKASLGEDLDKITYQIKATNKDTGQNDKELSLKLTPNPNSNIKDLKVKKMTAKLENKMVDTDVQENQTKQENSKPNIKNKGL